MLTLRIDINNRQVAEAFRRMPVVMQRHLGLAVERGAREVARRARELAPKDMSALTNSIRPERVAESHWQVVTGTNYAAFVERGTRGGGAPPDDAIAAWMKRKGIMPRDPKQSIEETARQIAMAIYRNGSTAKPFMEPALTQLEPRIRELVGAAVDAGVKEAMGGQA